MAKAEQSFFSRKLSKKVSRITHLGDVLDILKCDPVLVSNAARKVSHGDHLITLSMGESARGAQCAAADSPPSSPQMLRGKEQIAQHLHDICARDPGQMR